MAKKGTVSVNGVTMSLEEFNAKIAAKDPSVLPGLKILPDGKVVPYAPGGSGTFDMGKYAGGNSAAASGGINPIFIVVGVLAVVVVGIMIFKK